MAKKRSRPALPSAAEQSPGYDEVLAGISELLDRARRTTAQTINAILTTTYWEVGRRIVEFEQRGQVRAAYLVRRKAPGFIYGDIRRPVLISINTLQTEAGTAYSSFALWKLEVAGCREKVLPDVKL